MIRAASQLASTALQGLTSTAATNATSAATLSDFEGNVLFLPNVAQAALTPLNTTGLFTDLTFDDDELRDEATPSKEDDILKTFVENHWRLPEGVVIQTGFSSR